MWKFHRDMTRPFFDKHRISDFDIFDSHVEDAIDQMKVRLAEGHAVDFQVRSLSLSGVNSFTDYADFSGTNGSRYPRLCLRLPFRPRLLLASDPALVPILRD